MIKDPNFRSLGASEINCSKSISVRVSKNGIVQFHLESPCLNSGKCFGISDIIDLHITAFSSSHICSIAEVRVMESDSMIEFDY